MSSVLIGGLDGSLRNFGVVKMRLNLDSATMSVASLDLIETQKSKHKQVRASSDTLMRAQTLKEGVHVALEGCHICFAEVPYGGQSYDAVLGFGIVIGTYAGLSVPLIEVSPSETKIAAVGTRTASKEEMIDWAFETYPDAPWLTTKRAGKMVPTKKNEHLADAVAAVHAGIRTPAFKQVQAILKAGSAQAA